MAENTEFIREQQRAIERMREMSRRGIGGETHGMPPTPPFVRVNSSAQNRGENNVQNDAKAKAENGGTPKTKNNDIFGGLNLPFLEKIKNESDTTIIIGLLLLLWSEKSDKMLLLALLYLLF